MHAERDVLVHCDTVIMFAGDSYSGSLITMIRHFAIFLWHTHFFTHLTFTFRADDVVRRRGYCDHFVTMCAYVCGSVC